MHSERLSAIGELVAGVAHEINNPLQTIIGSVELLLEDRPDQGSRHDLEIVRREAARAGQIVRNLLSFVRRSAPDRSTADLNEIVRSVVELQELPPPAAEHHADDGAAAAPVPVLVNREEIQQIILNLMLNAEQAMLSADVGSTIAIRSLTESAHHIVEVVDDGPGVSAQMRGRIFEPFFTTKEVGQGTGLGLSISHGIAAAHGGSLDAVRLRVGRLLPAGAAGRRRAFARDDGVLVAVAPRAHRRRRGADPETAVATPRTARIRCARGGDRRSGARDH